MSSRSDSTQSSSSSTTSTTNQNDQRALADNGGLALAANAALNYTNAFPDAVKDAFIKVVNLAEGAGQIVLDSNAKLVQISETALNKFAAVQKDANVSATTQDAQVIQGSGGLTAAQMTKYVALAGVAIAAVVFFMKGKR